jgi:dihydropteroate synthase
MIKSINVKGNLMDLDNPKVMGILNLTPDSFYDGGMHNVLDYAMLQVENMLTQGADIIDIGAMSSKPNALIISEQEEADRLFPILEAIIKKYPNSVLSIDTFRANIAKQAISLGAAIINDISAGKMDRDMISTIANLQCPYIIMHMRGNAQTMQTLTQYSNVTIDVIKELSEQVFLLEKNHVNNIIVDPGFGFSKTLAQNFTLLNELEIVHKLLEKPILAGISRKSMIYKTLNSSALDALNGTTALNMVALQKGASIIRVHDVKAAKETILLYNALTQ